MTKNENKQNLNYLLFKFWEVVRDLALEKGSRPNRLKNAYIDYLHILIAPDIKNSLPECCLKNFETLELMSKEINDISINKQNEIKMFYEKRGEKFNGEYLFDPFKYAASYFFQTLGWQKTKKYIEIILKIYSSLHTNISIS